MKNTFDEITAARTILDLPEQATLAQIKHSYRSKLRKWHPDTCTDDSQKCLEMTRRITEAYTIILRYCNEYEFSFRKDDARKNCSAEEWWAQRFGNVPW
jgi:hypothetical protein